MKFADFICHEAINVELKATDRTGVIRELAQGLLDAGQLGSEQLDGIVKAILKREKLGSTGMGHGIAAPHAKYPGVSQTTGTVAVSQGGVDFGSLDGEPVHVFFLLVSPAETPDSHVQALKRIAQSVRSGMFSQFARQAKGVAEIVQLLVEADDNQECN
jgi:mannitol/fructose-specific phosphotransferase system IIA component (Ntr-type)